MTTLKLGTILLVLAFGLSACGLPKPLPMTSYLSSNQPQLLATAPLYIEGWHKQTNASTPLHIYIEGDGRPWLSRGRIAHDPTPVKPLALELALADASANVLYLARPCQFSARQLDPACTDDRWWTEWRYNPEVLSALVNAINAARKPGQLLVLIGYSGGGTMAALLATHFKAEVTQLITIAGNLSVTAFNEHHRVDAIPTALDPLSIAPQLTHIPQLHLVGEDDKVVPAQFARRFIAVQGSPASARLKVLPKLDHQHGWLESAPKLITQFTQ